jgi:hypothetical protein
MQRRKTETKTWTGKANRVIEKRNESETLNGTAEARGQRQDVLQELLKGPGDGRAHHVQKKEDAWNEEANAAGAAVDELESEPKIGDECEETKVVILGIEA